jgi:hypothetical protein
MSYFAKIENAFVVQIIKAEQDLVDTLNGTWVQFWKDANGESEKRYNSTRIGGIYNISDDAFLPPKSRKGWLLNSNFQYEAPTPKPNNTQTHYYYWDDETESWLTEEIPEE